MEQGFIESSYPLAFRKNDVSLLGEHVKMRHSVMLIGMKRVGISNFLRFFLWHPDIVKTYVGDGKNHLFIPIDLNDLVERELSPFWTLTLKRIVDACERSSMPESIKKEIEMVFLDSIQSQDLFLTIDSVRKVLRKIVEYNILPTLFFLRFDRIKDAVSPEFFANLQGIKDATDQKVAYVFTSFRGLDELSPTVFTRASLSLFSRDMYLKPAAKEDTKIIYGQYKKRYGLTVNEITEQALFENVDGYIQYLQLALIYFTEKKMIIKKKEDVLKALSKDERIVLQSEELWESLTEQEQHVLRKVITGKTVDAIDREQAAYLWNTGMVQANGGVFSPLFASYVEQKEGKVKGDNGIVEFTKKEHLLFTHLKDKVDEICEREEIISAVWPEAEALGISDWAIDRLVARVRQKLKLQRSTYEIQTVKTRGYKLVSNNR